MPDISDGSTGLPLCPSALPASSDASEDLPSVSMARSAPPARESGASSVSTTPATPSAASGTSVGVTAARMVSSVGVGAPIGVPTASRVPSAADETSARASMAPAASSASNGASISVATAPAASTAAHGTSASVSPAPVASSAANSALASVSRVPTASSAATGASTSVSVASAASTAANDASGSVTTTAAVSSATKGASGGVPTASLPFSTAPEIATGLLSGFSLIQGPPTAKSALFSLPESCPDCARCPVAPTVDVGRRATDVGEIRSSLRRIEAALIQDATLADLQRDHIALQRAHAALQRHVHDLHTQARTAADTANAFVIHCQGKYVETTTELQRAGMEISSLTQTAARLQTEVRELDEVRIRYEQRQTENLSILQELRNKIVQLRPRSLPVMEASDSGRSRELASRLDLVRGERDRAQHDLAVTCADLVHLLQRHRDLVTSDATLAAAANMSRDQVETLGRRIQSLRQDTTQLVEQLREKLNDSERLTARFRGECETVRLQFETPQRDLVIARQARSLAEAQRTRAQNAAQDYESRIQSLRARVSNLEGDKTSFRDLKRSHEISEKTLADLKADHNELQRERDGLRQKHQTLRCELKAVRAERDRLVEDVHRSHTALQVIAAALPPQEPGIVPISGPTAATVVTNSRSAPRQAPRPMRNTTATASGASTKSDQLRPSTAKRRLSTTPPSRRSAKISRTTPPASAPRSVGSRSALDISHGAAGVINCGQAPSTPRASGGSSIARHTGSSSSSSSDHDSLASVNSDDIRAAISGSRSVHRRRSLDDSQSGRPTSQARGSGPGSASHPIDVGGSGILDDSSDGEASSGGSKSHQNDSDHAPDEASRGRASVEASATTNTATADRDTQDEEFGLHPTRVPRCQWIPGTFEPRRFQTGEVDPWKADTVSALTCLDLTAQLLLKNMPVKPAWLFKKRHPAPSRYAKELITGAQIDALLEAQPWQALTDRPDPLSFNPQDMPAGLFELYTDLESKYLQEYWESTHFLQISKADWENDARVLEYYKDRKKRRTTAGQEWRAFLEVIATGIGNGLFDLDILLDPFFLQFPSRQEEKHWYPVIHIGSPSLLKSLTRLDEAEPWRNQYRTSHEDHPARDISRLQHKFLTRI